MDRAILTERLEYDESSPSGLRWKNTKCARIEPGNIAGTLIKTRKYWHVKVGAKGILCHHAIWIIFNGSIPNGMQIDHVDGDKMNNRIANLRLASASENSMNIGVRKDNKAGVKGLWKDSGRNRWCGQVMVAGKAHYKNSVRREVVEAWLIETRNKLHGEFARHE